MTTIRKKNEQQYRLNLHFVFTTRMLLRKLNKEGFAEKLQDETRKICEANDATLLFFEKGIADEYGRLQYEQSAVHLYIRLHGQVSPEGLLKQIRDAYAEISREAFPSEERSIWNKDYYITDNQNFDRLEVLEFVRSRLSKYKRKGAKE